MPVWLILQLLAIAAMPAAFDMAQDRGRLTHRWLWVTLMIGPLALVLLAMLGRAVRAVPANRDRARR